MWLVMVVVVVERMIVQRMYIVQFKITPRHISTMGHFGVVKLMVVVVDATG